MDIVSTALMGLFTFTGTPAMPTPDMALLATASPAAQEVPAAVEIPQISVLATAYNPVPEQTNENPLITASGFPSNSEIVAARSRDLSDQLPFGTIIAIEAPENKNNNCGFEAVSDQIGYRVILDTMHARKRQQVDVMFDQANVVEIGNKMRNPAEVLGMCEGVTVKVVGHVDLKHVPTTQLELVRLVEGNKLAQK